MAIDVRGRSPEEIRAFVFDRFKEYREKDFKRLLKERHRENIDKVESAFNLLTEWISNNAKAPRN
jgi:hypothetical protein